MKILNPKSTPRKVNIEYYKGKNKEWYWRFKSNGNTMADSGEGYSSKQACLKAIQTVKDKISNAEPEEVSE